jgi:hypothetical protein
MVLKANKVAVAAAKEKNINDWRKFGVQWVFA